MTLQTLRNAGGNGIGHVNVRGRSAGFAVCGMLVLLAGTSAQGEPARTEAKLDARACMGAYQGGQQKEQAGQLVEASHLFATCADEVCGTQLWKDCTAGSTRIYSTLPSVVPIVLDESGEPRVDVRVKMDGRLIASHINGRSIAVDPGTHELSFGTDSGIFASRKITIAKGERNRAISVLYPSSYPSSAPAAQK